MSVKDVSQTGTMCFGKWHSQCTYNVTQTLLSHCILGVMELVWLIRCRVIDKITCPSTRRVTRKTSLVKQSFSL